MSRTKGRHRKGKVSKISKRLAAMAGFGAVAIVSPAIGDIGAQAAPMSTLHGVAFCESTSNATAQNPNSTASGAFQFLDSTWAGYGGYSRAMYAPFSVQLNKALATPLSAWEASRSCWGSGAHNGVPFPGDHISASPKSSNDAIAKRPRHSNASPSPHSWTPNIASPPSQPKHSQANGKHYTVKSGDTLWRISGANWRHTYDVNRSVIGSNPNLIQPGQVLNLS